ncbi:PEP-CTERM sorting domain-containing protein [Ectothiorhodospira marina]|uniref:PEP-CTERM sorting domain-containing protein n=1 Tax=Ectothiorhodospira marina TaxID=1396821 RepID=UPI003CCBA7C2
MRRVRAVRSTVRDQQRGCSGGFILTGDVALSWTGVPPTNSNLVFQIKGAQGPSSVAEPATLALLGLGMMYLGFAAFRRTRCQRHGSDQPPYGHPRRTELELAAYYPENPPCYLLNPSCVRWHPLCFGASQEWRRLDLGWALWLATPERI